ncbi:MAG: lysine--tRNA ligase [Deltaproteobacteria bacterium]|nr:lysine--tRNA ligase [Deltaproteobacteria bacterium]
MSEENQYYLQRKEKAQQLAEKGINPYPNGLKPSHPLGELVRAYNDKTKEELEQSKVQVQVAGRVLLIRSFGKAAFITLRDRSGDLQCYVRKDQVPETEFEVFKTLDMGDFAYCEGYLFRTKTNELSVHVEHFHLAGKGLRNLPEKWHGLTDIEARYRQRYVDLIVNPGVKDVFRKRAQIIAEMRKFFIERDFLECETPMMHPIPGGAKAKPFVTHHNALGMDLYLRIAPELYLKRLVVGGFERVFEVNRNFRNEGISIQHNPEFTMLEFYQAYATYEDLMTLTEDLLEKLATTIVGSSSVTYQGEVLQFKKPFKRLPLYQSLLEIGKVPPEIMGSREKALQFAEAKNIKLTSPKESLPVLLTEIFEDIVEPKLIQPMFITHYPTEVSPLSRRNAQDPDLTDRFELFIFGREIANGFSELNDPVDQRGRFLEQLKAKEAGDEEAMGLDEDFINALEYGMPPTAGEGIGIDRLVMLLTDQPSIRDVILFPHMRHK